MSDPDINTPISVRESPAVDQIMAAVRQVLVALGGFAVGKGWVDESTASAVTGLVLVVGPIVWSQIAVRGRHAKLVVTAEAAPNAVATVDRG
ncbi:hypothetical protein [Phenylobacterium sp.]|uniref:Pam3-gp28 family putative phage holin n=1 Tax=Phenylobacterium sp. TaxID=1871053 RepID=UPI002735E344|nr:hypothetical protein [Phenylobacterium sp.]MDP3853139.1 hypothetical protein [Phenylobacterium sp.]